jgi:hypothetical protein
MARAVSRRHHVVAVLVTACLVAASACGGSSGSDRAGGTGRQDATASPGISAKAYIGLSKRAAIAKAEAAGRPWRIVREDDETFPVTMDYVAERINFEIDDGTVTKATFG